MARIRTIKPEFPQSETIGSLCREARLCFVLLWTLSDDSGRLRGNSRMLASLLYPYDDDAVQYMEGWLSELSEKGCVTRYEVDGKAYLQINGWNDHQKIDKPSPSKLPPPPGNLANPREDSAADQGRDQGVDQGEEGAGASARERKTKIPAEFDLSDRVIAWAKEKGYGQLEQHLEAFKHKCRAKGYTYIDWDDAFMEAIRKDWAGLRGKTSTGAPPAGEHTTVPMHPNATSALEKIKADAGKAAPVPEAIRQLTRKLTGKEHA